MMAAFLKELSLLFTKGRTFHGCNSCHGGPSTVTVKRLGNEVYVIGRER